MKKQLHKPENWQDFESLCKKLWGEVWGIPSTIKKNGRNGEPQNGVDIYGKPKGELNYWGIQCKGKDDYSHAKISKKEIESEIEKAKNFKPNIDVFLIATTANKDSEIEEYVRILDIESKRNGGFEISLFCWEDIVDLIEENRTVFEYYVNNNQFRYKFDFEVFLAGNTKDIVLEPIYYRKLKKYKLIKDSHRHFSNTSRFKSLITHHYLFDNPNGAMCEFDVYMKNTGSVVIENWHVLFTIYGEHKEVDDFKYHSGGMPNFSYDTEKRDIVAESKIKYCSERNESLIQEDERLFPIIIIPLAKEYSLTMKWELKARDFQQKGELFLHIKPKFEDEIEFIYVKEESEIKETEVISIRENKYEIEETGS